MFRMTGGAAEFSATSTQDSINFPNPRPLDVRLTSIDRSSLEVWPDRLFALRCRSGAEAAGQTQQELLKLVPYQSNREPGAGLSLQSSLRDCFASSTTYFLWLCLKVECKIKS